MKNKVMSTLFILLLSIIAIMFDYQVFAIVISLCACLLFDEIYKYKYGNSNNITIIKFISMLSIVFILLNNIFYTLPVIFIYALVLLSITIPTVLYDNSKKYNIADSIYLFGVIAVVSIGFTAIIELCKINVAIYIYVFLVAFMCDIYSYVGSRLIGKHKICKSEQTVEGVSIGIVMATFISSVYYYNIIGSSLMIVIPISLILCIGSVFGDIIFYNIMNKLNKDKLSLSITNQFDSIIIVALIYTIIINII